MIAAMVLGPKATFSTPRSSSTRPLGPVEIHDPFGMAMPPITGTHVFLSTVNETCFVVLLTSHSDAYEAVDEKHNITSATNGMARKKLGMRPPLRVPEAKQSLIKKVFN